VTTPTDAVEALPPEAKRALHTGGIIPKSSNAIVDERDFPLRTMPSPSPPTVHLHITDPSDELIAHIRDAIQTRAADTPEAAAGEPHQAEILVEWWPSASIGEHGAVRHLLEGWCGQLMERLQALGVTDPTVELDIAAPQPPSAGAVQAPEAGE
jgi:hypothetical protein